MLELFIWDTCGQEKYRSITRQYYAKAHTILLVFDLTSEKAFDDLQSHLYDVDKLKDEENKIENLQFEYTYDILSSQK
jgi:GTPase SAR1 family protein